MYHTINNLVPIRIEGSTKRRVGYPPTLVLLFMYKYAVQAAGLPHKNSRPLRRITRDEPG